jgi:membrane fusion protein
MTDGGSSAVPVKKPVDDVDPNLFRREALDAATTRYGAPIRPMGVAGWGLTGFLVVLFLAVAVFLAVGRYTRKETVVGVLQPSAGAARVTALAAGVISEVRVTDGQVVRAGDPILVMSTDRTVTDGEAISGSLSDLIGAGSEREALALAEQARSQAAVNARALEDLRARRAGLEDDQTQLAQNLLLQHDRVRLAEETLAAGRTLHERQLFSTLQLRQREEALIAARQGVASIEREMRRNQASMRQMAAEEGRLAAQAAQSVADMELARAQFDQRRAQRLSERAIVLTAAKSGRVVALSARTGAPVQPGRALAIILPEGETLQAELWAPSRAAGFLRAGDRVRLMYDAFPYQKFGVGRGRVISVAGAPVDPADLTVPIEAKEALYRVLVDIESPTVDGYGGTWRLTPGMRLSADLVLDDRSLWEWLFDPIIAARRRAEA